MVQHALRRNETSKQDWRDKVVRAWFDNTDEPASEFLRRANRFLREDMEHSSKGMSIFDIYWMLFNCLSFALVYVYYSILKKKIKHCRICIFPCKYRCGMCAPQWYVCATHHCGTCVTLIRGVVYVDRFQRFV
jgi:hypothetical protein